MLSNVYYFGFYVLFFVGGWNAYVKGETCYGGVRWNNVRLGERWSEVVWNVNVSGMIILNVDLTILSSWFLNVFLGVFS